MFAICKYDLCVTLLQAQLLCQLKKQVCNKRGLGKNRILCPPILSFSLPDTIYCLFVFTTFPTEQKPGTG